MKVYRLVTLFAAVLITVFLARVLSDERVGDPQGQSPIATANAP
jgi:hypothetical protein